MPCFSPPMSMSPPLNKTYKEMAANTTNPIAIFHIKIPFKKKALPAESLVDLPGRLFSLPNKYTECDQSLAKMSTSLVSLMNNMPMMKVPVATTTGYHNP